MFQSSPEEDVLASLPGRSWKGIALRARRLELARDKRVGRGRGWSREDDERLKVSYEKGETQAEIAKELGRGVAAITVRIQGMADLPPGRPRKRRVDWEVLNLISSQQSSSRGGLRG